MEQQKILIDNQQKTKIQTRRISQKTEQILNALGCNAHEISIVILDDQEMAQLNKTYRGINKPTNVLAFPMQEGEFSEITPGLLGDVVISMETAEREAVTARISLEERTSQLLIHGILHLLGFDHEMGDREAAIMEKKSLELLRLVEKNIDLTAF
ncbi:MAG: rRNA maturation RNase YbeY [Deltaproteobacteria bacterium]|nr:MAG: rRNA maturation RNase YbeY [Deltaproteobacteria bacterium]